MPETLATYLKRRAERSYRYFLEQAEDWTPEEALRDRKPDWPDHEWGIGQNGSVAGIVYHVAAWKQMTLPLFQPGGTTRGREEFDAASAPAPDDWPGILVWLKQAGTAWNAELAALPEAAFDETCDWFGTPMALAKLVTEMHEHDIQHGAQLEYLRQLYRTLTP